MTKTSRPMNSKSRQLADAGTAVVQHQLEGISTDSLNEPLESILQCRRSLDQAKGLVTEPMNCPLEESFERLRRYARTHSLHLTDAARSVELGSLEIADLI